MTEPELHLGDDGEWVVLLQVRLYGLGLLREIPDQTFGSSTENAVRELQMQLGQSPTGEVTADTWATLAAAELQANIQYRYPSPYDALDQIVYDLQHGVHRDGSGNLVPPDQYAGMLSDDLQYQWDGYAWQPAGDGERGADGFLWQLSEDRQYQWDGYEWHPFTGDTGHVGDMYAGQLSEDRQYRWDGIAWQPAGGAESGYIGQLSHDGFWRWDGSQWQVA
ncbi:MAG TPA: peptidoglycan-binding domain-containing protein [Micromonosporaceae bacterium]|jgi:hypothetical protein